MNVLRKTLNSSESSQPLRGLRQITFIMLNSFCPLSKKTPHPLVSIGQYQAGRNAAFSFLTDSPMPLWVFCLFCRFSLKCLLKYFFFQKFIDRILRKYLPRFQLQILWFSFQNIFQESYFHTSICNYL